MPGLARALSKLGHCSRSRAAELIRAGAVTLNGRICRDPEKPVVLGQDQITVGDSAVTAAAKVYLMLNKPRGLVTTTRDEHGRATVYECFQDPSADGPRLPDSVPATALFPVGRLDKASEGALLFTNDHAWAHRITDPATHLDKTYHVQVDCVVDDTLMRQLRAGAVLAGETLAAREIHLLRQGQKNSWLQIVLDEGKNRHIRRLLEAFHVEVLRLVRVAIGGLMLGDLPKGQWRLLTPAEVRSLGAPGD
jgi:23S rRNA pseudouridine2605 synthase